MTTGIFRALQIERREARRAQVLNLKRAGLTHVRIAEKLGVNRATVRRDVAKLRARGLAVTPEQV